MMPTSLITILAVMCPIALFWQLFSLAIVIADPFSDRRGIAALGEVAAFRSFTRLYGSHEQLPGVPIAMTGEK